MAFQLALGVTPEGLKNKSTDLTTDIQEMQTKTQNLLDEVEGMAAYWQGQASTQAVKNFQEKVMYMNKMLERLRTYPTRILQMAGIYEEAEETNVATASTTSTDIVMQ